MTTRVDSKPLYYGNTIKLAFRPLLLSNNGALIDAIKKKIRGHISLFDDPYNISESLHNIMYHEFYSDYLYEQLERETLLGTDPTTSSLCTAFNLRKMFSNRNALAQDLLLTKNISEIWHTTLQKTNMFYHGSEAAIAYVAHVLNGHIFQTADQSKNLEWAKQCVSQITALQASACMSHSDAWGAIASLYANTMDRQCTNFWGFYADSEKILLRGGSAHIYKAHLHHGGKRTFGFVPEENIADDFKIYPHTRLHNILKFTK